MSPLLVFRIEDDEHVGPWRSRLHAHGGGFDANLLAMSRMPTSYCGDTFVGPRYGQMQAHRHGLTEPQLGEWLCVEDRAQLRRVGVFRIGIYLCPPGTIAYGEHQIVFESAEAIRTEELPL